MAYTFFIHQFIYFLLSGDQSFGLLSAGPRKRIGVCCSPKSLKNELAYIYKLTFIPMRGLLLELY